MNAKRRTSLGKIIDQMECLAEKLRQILEEEEAARDNVPESLQLTDRWADMETACDTLNEVADEIEGAVEALRQLLEV